MVWPWAWNIYRIVASVAVGVPINFDIFSGYPRFYDGYVPPLKAKAQPTTHCASKEWAWRDPLVACMLVPFASPPHTSCTKKKVGGGGKKKKNLLLPGVSNGSGAIYLGLSSNISHIFVIKALWACQCCIMFTSLALLSYALCLSINYLFIYLLLGTCHNHIG